MKLTENQIHVIRNYTDSELIDQEKLISYLEKHNTIKNEVFSYCSKVDKWSCPDRGFCIFLIRAPMYTPVDRTAFIRRIPFYFFQIQTETAKSSGLSRIIPVSKEKEDPVVDYEDFYSDLEWMFYDLRIPLEIICDYCWDQVLLPPKPQAERHRSSFGLNKNINSILKEGSLSGKQLFQQWRHYLHLCNTLGWTDLAPARFITAYNEALEASGLPPIIYHPIKEKFLGCYFTSEDSISCEGHFPCDKQGKPILRWTSIKVKNATEITYRTEKSQCGELAIKYGPTTLIYAMDEDSTDDEDPVWAQLYVGPQAMEFNNEALRYFRKKRKMTQGQVANAIGSSVRTYQKWESGETTPDGHSLLRLINWLAIPDVQCLVKVIEINEEEDVNENNSGER